MDPSTPNPYAPPSSSPPARAGRLRVWLLDGLGALVALRLLSLFWVVPVFASMYEGLSPSLPARLALWPGTTALVLAAYLAGILAANRHALAGDRCRSLPLLAVVLAGAAAVAALILALYLPWARLASEAQASAGTAGSAGQAAQGGIRMK
jgi:hypothetical protein